jgi:hypothetical protein
MEKLNQLFDEGAGPILGRLRKQTFYPRVRMVVNLVAFGAVALQALRALVELGEARWSRTTTFGVAGALFGVVAAVALYAIGAFIARALVMAFLDVVDSVLELRLRSAAKDADPE